MPGNVRRNTSQEFCQAPYFVVGVVEPRDQQRHYLHPEAHFVEPADGIENRLKPASKLPVMPVVETLEVYLVQIHPWLQEVEHLRGAVSVRDESRHQPRLLRLFEHGNRPLARDQRLIVGADHDLAALLELHQGSGSSARMRNNERGSRRACRKAPLRRSRIEGFLPGSPSILLQPPSGGCIVAQLTVPCEQLHHTTKTRRSKSLVSSCVC